VLEVLFSLLVVRSRLVAVLVVLVVMLLMLLLHLLLLASKMQWI
jgi:hypothetical protein